MNSILLCTKGCLGLDHGEQPSSIYLFVPTPTLSGTNDHMFRGREHSHKHERNQEDRPASREAIRITGSITVAYVRSVNDRRRDMTEG